ncbi:hypothetical protein ACFWNN_28685 [Lentzea sp. NPDC058450]|uniref:hypothetical protein n=1 Tax=Lentzea sp. NPDC058450 TaxID=3346505 RepID=UPI00364D3983
MGEYESVVGSVAALRVANLEAAEFVATLKPSAERMRMRVALNELAEVLSAASTLFDLIENSPLNEGVADADFLSWSTKIQNFDKTVRSMNLSSIVEIENKDNLGIWVDHVRALANDVRSSFAYVVDWCLGAIKRKSLSGRQGETLDYLEGNWSPLGLMGSIVSDAKKARDEVVSVLEDARQAAGEAADAVLSVHFSKFAAGEQRRAEWLRGGAIGCLMVLVLAAAIILPQAVKSDSTVASVLARLTFSIPLAVLAAYLGKESSKHRELARWARQLEVRLLTFDAFVAPLSEDQRREQRVAFGDQIFLGERVQNENGAAGPSLMGEAASLLASVSELMKGLPGVEKRQ